MQILNLMQQTSGEKVILETEDKSFTKYDEQIYFYLYHLYLYIRDKFSPQKFQTFPYYCWFQCIFISNRFLSTNSFGKFIIKWCRPFNLSAVSENSLQILPYSHKTSFASFDRNHRVENPDKVSIHSHCDQRSTH